MLSPLYERVVAIDRSPARLARCAERVSALGLPNVRLREGAVEDAGIIEEIARAGGADLVVVSRVLHHVARPQELVAAAARLLRPGGGSHLAIVDHIPHEDESLRERGHVWLGFDPAKLRAWLEAAGLEVVHVGPLRAGSPRDNETPPLQLAVGRAPGPSLN